MAIKFLNSVNADSGVLYVDAANDRVGIGTTSPSTKLHVKEGNANILIGADDTYGANYSAIGFGGLTNGFNRIFAGFDGSAVYDDMYYAAGTGKGHQFRTNGSGSTKVIITSAGNVGIGTTSPSYKLEVNGKIATPAGAIVIEGQEIYANSEYSGNDGSVRINRFGYLGGQTRFRDTVIYDGKGNQILTVDGSTSNIGIRTTAPISPLDVVANSGGNSIALRMRPTSNDYSFIQGRSNDGTEVVGEIAFNRTAATTGNMLFYTGNGTNSVERMRITSAGNVGIGTTSPNSWAQLETTGTVAVGGILYVKSSQKIQGLTAFPGGAGNLSINPDGGNVGIGTTSPIAKLSVLSASTGYSSDSQIKISDGSTSYYGGLSFDDAGSTRLSVRNSYDGTGSIVGFGFGGSSDKVQIINGTGLIVNEGNVGIGTTSPDAKLDVEGGAVRITYNSSYNLELSNPSGSGIINANGDSATLRFGTTAVGGSTATEKMRISPSGNVGIGTTSPTQKLEVAGNIKLSGYIVDSNSEIIDFAVNDLKVQGKHINAEFGVWARSYGTVRQMGIDGGASYMGLYTSGTEKVRIDTSGNVGIGTTSPVNAGGNASWLTIDAASGNAYSGGVAYTIGGAVKAYHYVESNYLRHQSQSGVGHRFTVNAGTQAMIINTSGNVGIGTTSPSHTLDVNGELRVGTVVPQTSADFSVRRNGANIEFGHGNRTSGYYGTIGVQGNNGMPYIALSADCESSVNTFTTRGFKGNVITTDGAGSLMFSQLTTANATGQSLTERMRITSAGRVGIGTTNPAYHIHGLSAESGWGYSFQNATGDEDVNVYMSHGGGYGIAVDSTENTSGKYLLKLSGGTGGGTGIGSVVRMIVTAAGNVGIGTTNPDSLLQIGESFTTTSGTNKKIIANIGGYYSTSSGFQYQTLGFTGTTFDESDISAQTSGEVLKNFYIGLFSDVGYFNGNRFSIYQGGAERLSIKQGGNVGIGTTTPSAKLDVAGQIITSDSVRFTGNVSAPTGNSVFRPASNTIAIGTASVERVRIDASGNVGIGTTSPAKKLDVRGGYFITSDGGTNEEAFVQGGNGYAYFGNYSTGKAAFGNSEDWTTLVADGGNVGIGTTSPREKLDVDGDIVQTWGNDKFIGLQYQQGAAYQNGLLLHGDNRSTGLIAKGGTGSTPYIWFGVSEGGNTERMRITKDGNVGIGTASPSEKLHVVGDVRIEGDLTVNGSYTQIDTDVNTTEQWNVTNDGTGPAVTINQTGAQDIMDVQDDGTSVLYIEDGGNVGLGTTNPTTTLDVRGDIKAEGANTPTISVKDTTNDLVGRLRAANSYVYLTADHGDTVASSRIVFQVDGDSSAYVTNGLFAAETSVQFTTYGSGTETGTAAYALAVDSSGNVIETSYIPSSSSTDFVAVAGDTMSGGLNIEVSTSNTQLKLKRTTSATGEFNIYTNTDSLFFHNVGQSTYPMMINSSGNVGIGTTSPSAKLHAKSSGNGTYILRGMSSAGTDLGGLYQSTAGDGEIYLKTSAVTTNVRISSNNVSYLNGGNVGIGTTSPSAKLDVDGVIRSRGGTYAADTDTKTDVGLVIPENNFIYTADGSDYLRKLIGKTSDIITIGEAGTSLIDGINLVPGTAGGYVQIFNNSSIAAKFVDGKLGIGTTSPDEKLSVIGNTGLYGTVSGGIVSPASLRFFTSEDGAGLGDSTDSNKQKIGQITWAGKDTSLNATGEYAAIRTYVIDSNNLIQGSAGEGGQIEFSILRHDVGANPRVEYTAMTINNSANVGIGTTSPNRPLTIETNTTDVLGALKIKNAGAGDASMFFTVNASGAVWQLGIDNSDGDKFKIGQDTQNADVGVGTKLTIDSSGNVGIGTTSPTSKLHVVGDTSITGNLTVDGNIDLDTKGDYITFYGNGAVNHSITSRDVNGNADDDIRINSYHNVYINLDSNSNNASNDTGFFIGEHGGGDGVIANNKFAVYADGNVEIGGNVTAGNDSGIYSFSDTVNASASEDIFSISNDHGAQAFRVTFVCSTSGYSVAKTFEVVHSHGIDPVFFKVVDTGAFGSHDFDVSFATEAGGAVANNNKIICTITNSSTTINANIVTTVFLGGSPTAITVTAL